MEYQNSREQAVDYNAQGKMLYSLDRFEEALAYYRKAEACDPMCQDTYLNMGESLIMLDRFDEAETAYQKLLLITKENGEAFFHLGNVAFLRDNKAAGREYYAKAVNAGFEVPDIYMNMGYMLFNEGGYEEAIGQFNKALAMDKFLPHAWLNKARANMMLNRMPEAMQALEGLIQYVPDVFEGHHYKFLLHVQENDMTSADETLKRMERMFPDDEAVWMDRLMFIETQGDAKKAMAYYEEKFAASEKPEHLMEKAKIVSSLEGRGAEAVAILNKLAVCGVEEIEDQALTYTIVIGLSVGNLGAANTACDAILEKSKKDDDYYNALYFKAYVQERMGNKVEAKAAYEKATAELRLATSKNPGALNYYVLRVMAHRGLGERQKALELVNYMLMVREDMPEALYMRAELYEELHETEKAKADRAKLRQAPGVYGPILQTLNMARK